MATKPTKLPRWADGGTGTPTNVTEPLEATKNTGYLPGNALPAQVLNWIWNLGYQWFAYLQDLANQAITWTATATFLGTLRAQSGVTFGDGSQQTKAAPFVQGGTATHGQAITFPTPYADTPAIIISGGISTELRNRWGATGSGGESGAPYASPTNTYDDYAALSASATGFTVRARLKQKGSGSVVAESIGSPGIAATAAGQSSPSNATTPVPGIGDNYVVTYSGGVTATRGNSSVEPGAGPPYPISSCSASVTVAIDYATDGVTWTEVAGARRSFSATNGSTTIPATAIAVTVPGMTASGKFRARVVTLTKTNDTSWDGSGTVSCSISLPTTGAVTYNYSSSTTDQYASKTPDTGDTVSWVAIGHV